MTPFQHLGPEWVDRPWWGGLGWLLPLLLLAVLTGLVVWAVMRTARQPAVAGGPPPGPLPAPPAHMIPPAVAPFGGQPAAGPGTAGDPALETVRLRYARGEMTRDEFVQVSRDLGAPAASLDVSEGGEADA